ncbi:DegT/DnrJ/EryC1/StrS family aminotransferase [Rhodoblastus acidophilus]|uniref:DegT/DnrJ/EryC1/StrS family aminotransferase n=1 Tax=Candidatus Rhodoblastus alkanivorans TaxID=2954117 RepID=A0ABS9ZAC8_9HYPH|nr:DegT/DnrJ/EryC1/StrS family aminotransferase [Candidatus Rhodoblastus alkanivorans]MCI4677087.1 DegT/DnrJ/EryC1/StrS family aminotransferase [Candidatus Rhodoblastus alkanivorans]MCI4684440.1 DegT/DnrJ/EryC1/StrS family aminotransferase [Candidatus Rhodoblastus alkanivorans]MDI4641761.1 DegT/DnrJ/EryC1/StrS family aminotransferase [Rhodoblastus acidophilus]
MTEPAYEPDEIEDEDVESVRIPLSDPDMTMDELQAVDSVLRTSRVSNGATVAEFEAAFAAYLGRRYAIAVPSGTIGLFLILMAKGIGPGDEVIAPSFSFRETAQAIAAIGATPVFADIDYWSGAMVAPKAEAKITPKTRAILAANPNGHPADWSSLRELADKAGLMLIEDSSEAIGSKYKDQLVGTFGDASVFDFAQPMPLTCGEGGMIVTDDPDLAMAIKRRRAHAPEERGSVAVTTAPALQLQMSDITAALGLAQLRRLEEILEKRLTIEHLYNKYVQSFEGIKPPYVAPDVTEVHWFLYVVHLGTRFSKSSRDAIVDDLATEHVEATGYCNPLHLQRFYVDRGWRRGDLFVTEKVADRAVALPYHCHLTEGQIEFIVATMKDASINVGAGAAIY